MFHLVAFYNMRSKGGGGGTIITSYYPNPLRVPFYKDSVQNRVYVCHFRGCVKTGRSDMVGKIFYYINNNMYVDMLQLKETMD